MTVTNSMKRLGGPSHLTTTGQATICTCGEAKTQLARYIRVVNRSAAGCSLTLWLVPAGASAGDANVWTPPVAIGPGGIYEDDAIRAVLEAGDSIVAQASVADALVVSVHGMEAA
jgi:hypothetical protein